MVKKQKNKKGYVLVTGATGDIGTAILREFVINGHPVIGQYRSAKVKALKLKKEIESLHAEARFIQADFSSEAQINRFIKAVSQYPIVGLINNAGGYKVKRHYSRLTATDIQKTFLLNSTAPMLIAAKLFERMKKNRFGRIVNVSSISAKYGGSTSSLHYACAKMALEGLTRGLAKDGARFNVLVNTIRPGVIDTSFHKRFPKKNMRERIKLIPLKKMGKPQDVAEMTYFLGSQHNQYITNEIYAVAGGE